MKVEAATTRKLPTHQITVIRSDASTLPDIPSPPEPKPFVQGLIGEPHYLLSFGATVYDHRLSHVTWYDPRTKENQGEPRGVVRVGLDAPFTVSRDQDRRARQFVSPLRVQHRYRQAFAFWKGMGDAGAS